MNRILAILGFLAITASALAADDGSGLRIAFSSDIVGQGGLHTGSGASDALKIRGAEIALYSPADHLFEGMGSFAAHAEGFGGASVELHEAFLSSSKLIPRSRFRLGQFFLGVGRLNQFHQHDWPFITAPKVHSEFFAAEGALDTGLEYSFLFPLPFYLEATAGITNGFIYGHSHDRKPPRPLFPTNYLRLVTYLSLPWDGGTQIGVNYLGRRGNEGTQRTMFGLDVTAKWKEDKVTKFLFQSELWYRELTPRGAVAEKALGFYLYPEYHMGDGFFAGMRFDYYSILNIVDALGSPVKKVDLNVVPTMSWKPSEFVTLRLSYNHKAEFTGAPSQTYRFFEVQSIFILGAHPAHDF